MSPDSFVHFKNLPQSFYQLSADSVGPELLGHWLIRNTPDGRCGGLIVETEAYLTGDEASHTFRGLTKRNRAMFGPPGHGYVYFIYGNHWCYNVVCNRPGIGEAVLIRAIEPVFGVDLMRRRRLVKNERDLTNGPGKLCAAMDIDRSLDGLDVCDVNAPLFVARNPKRSALVNKSASIITTTRVGITKAAALPLRFFMAGNPFVSRPATFSKGQS